MSGSKHLIVFMKTGHPDSEALLLKILREFPNHHVDCVLTPRVVDFSVRPYGDDLAVVESAVGRKRALTPLLETPPWAASVLDDLQKWFHADADASHEEVMEDSAIHLQVCAMQFRAVLTAAGLAHDDCSFYWDQDSLKKVNLMQRHVSSIPTFAYDFNDVENDAYAAYDKMTPTGEERRKLTRDLCHAYLVRKAKEFQMDDWEDSNVKDFSDLIYNHSQTKPDCSIIVGDSFTEACTYVTEVKGGLVLAQSSSFGDLGTRLYEPNFQDDTTPAANFFDLASRRNISITIIPMEVVKDPVWKLSSKELAYVCQENRVLQKHLDLFKRGSGNLDKDYMLPGLAVATVACREGVLGPKVVKYQLETDAKGKKIINFVNNPDGNIAMAHQTDDFCLAQHERGALLKMMKM